MPRKKKVDTVPMPIAEDNDEFNAAAVKIKEGLESKPKRHRRSRAEIEAERSILTDNGFELFRDFIRMLSDNDAIRYGLVKQPPEMFEPIARQYAQITNHFLPKGKPIYYVCVSAVFMSFCMMKERKDLIDKKLYPNGKPAKQREESGVDTRKKGDGQVFPSETETQNL